MALIAFDVDPTTATDFWYLDIPKLGHTHINLKFKVHPILQLLLLSMQHLQEE